MTFRSPRSAAKDSVASNEDHDSAARPVRGQQSVWGLPPPRRGLTPLSTNLNPAADSAPARNPSSSVPFTPSFSSLLSGPGSEETARNSQSSFASRSAFPSLRAGSQQGHSGPSLSSPRSRAITPSPNSQTASSAAASTTASQVGGAGTGGGGGGLRTQTFSPPPIISPTSSAFDRNNFSNPPSASSSQSSVSKIVTTQIFLLLGSITEKEGKAKWEAQAEAIRKLVDSNGMENFPKYFRRLVQGNSPQIFPGVQRNVENPGNYPILVQEMRKVTQDLQHASRIADALDTNEGDVFRDFDLTTFIDHFKLNSYAKILLASAFTRSNRQDLRTKATAISSHSLAALQADLADSKNEDSEASPLLIATCAIKAFQDVSETLRNDDLAFKLKGVMELRYSKQRIELPDDVRSAVSLLGILDRGGSVMKAIGRRGPRVTSNAEAARAFATELFKERIREDQIAQILLFIVLTPDWQSYDPEVLVSALHREDADAQVDWQKVVKGLDRPDIDISKQRFLVLFKALLPIAKAEPNFDLQMLWGGEWSNFDTQLSFLRAFVSCSPAELDASTIPRLRKVYDPRDSADGTETFQKVIDMASKDPIISLDAVEAIIHLLIPANEARSQNQDAYLFEMLSEKAGLFLCSLAGIPKHQWTLGQEDLMRSLLRTVLRTFAATGTDESGYVLHTAWKEDNKWVAGTLADIHMEDPLELVMILHVAQELDWMDDLLTLLIGFGIDLAALAHRKGLLDLDQWLHNKKKDGPEGVINALAKFLVLKAQDEIRTSREEQPRPRTVSLSVKTVYDMLRILDDHMEDRDGLKTLQRQCLQAYPRLIIFCEGIHKNIDVECTESNDLPAAADAEMQDLYKRMYSLELTVPQILEYLQQCRESDDPAKLDLFACMIHGLFDEFSCFSEYPLAPLATTAVLFGGILHVRLISDLTLRVGQEMVLDSVRDYAADEKMYKFGLQALIHIMDRLEEPEWADYCAKLVKIPGLRGTEAHRRASRALILHGSETANGLNVADEQLDITNGDMDDMLSADSTMLFRSINAQPTPVEEEPDETLQEKVVFFFNNVTEQNLKSKIGQIDGALHARYQQWFARSLVEGRAKVEPNNQPLYMAILETLSNRSLWAEVLRETLVSVQKLLNAESTMQSPSDRKFLKNLSLWLGSLTLARDKPIKHRDIAFLDLLVEGYNMQKLILVVPFTCNVLAQGARSQIFKPPNPWVVEVIAGLMELYKAADIKLNLKFEIEVLLKEFGLNIDSVEPSFNYRGREHPEEDFSGTMHSDGLDHFHELSLGGLSRPGRNLRFDVDSITSTMPDLREALKFPPASGSAASEARFQHIVIEAVRRAIVEIVAPVVERSVTIATITTSNLVHKDFATEDNEDRVRDAAQQMAQQLSGSLALATCKEPLKIGMTNYIRQQQGDTPGESFPEGHILMCVNDNLEAACKIVEDQAEQKARPEIEAHIETELAARRQHRAEHPGEPFMGDSYSRWSGFISDPYKMVPGGLNQEQMAIYLEFARQSRGSGNHAQSASVDSGRQVPDILQDSLSSMANVQLPGDNVAMVHQSAQQQLQNHHSGRMLPSSMASSIRGSQSAGYVDIGMIEDRVQDLMNEVRRSIQEDPNDSTNTLIDLLSQTWDLIESSPDPVALNCAESICKIFFAESMSQHEVNILAQLLSKLYDGYPNVRTEVTEWARSQHDEQFLTVEATVALVKVNIMQLSPVDMAMARLIYQRGDAILGPISKLMDELLLTSRPFALRSDFARTMGSLSQLYTEHPSLKLQSFIQHLRDWGMDESPDDASAEDGRLQQHMRGYVFAEWVRICESNPGTPKEKYFSAFVSQLRARRIVGSQEETGSFLRLCIDEIVNENDHVDDSPFSAAFLKVDSLARLIVVLVKTQAPHNGLGDGRALYMDSILALITLVMNQHSITRGEHFNQRIFFRLFSTILSEWHDYGREGSTQDHDMLLIFAYNFLMMNPNNFPAFTFSWLSLISHRLFMPALLKLPHADGCDAYCEILGTALGYIGAQLKTRSSQALAAELYKPIVRLLLILHHDFPEFLAENHFRLCNAIPFHAPQLSNLVLSAYPSSFPELPNPFVTALKVDRLEEMKQPPRITRDYQEVLIAAQLKERLDAAIHEADAAEEFTTRLLEAIQTSGDGGSLTNRALIHAVVLHIGQSATSSGLKSSQAFDSQSPAASLLIRLARELPSAARYLYLSAMVHQLRYPNSHTYYFSYALLHLFSAESDVPDAGESEIRMQITRVLVERLHVVKPQPWGLVVTALELLKNPEYAFWGQGFVKDTPAIQTTCEDVLKMGEESQRWSSGQYAPGQGRP